MKASKKATDRAWLGTTVAILLVSLVVAKLTGTTWSDLTALPAKLGAKFSIHSNTAKMPSRQTAAEESPEPPMATEAPVSAVRLARRPKGDAAQELPAFVPALAEDDTRTSSLPPANALPSSTSEALPGLAPASANTFRQGPPQAVLKQATTFPALLNGKPMGTVALPAGTKINLISQGGATMIIEHAGARVTVPASAVELPAAP